MSRKRCRLVKKLKSSIFPGGMYVGKNTLCHASVPASSRKPLNLAPPQGQGSDAGLARPFPTQSSIARGPRRAQRDSREILREFRRIHAEFPARSPLSEKANGLFRQAVYLPVFSQSWLATPQEVLQADWQEVWHSPQPPVLTLAFRSRVSTVLILFMGTSPFPEYLCVYITPFFPEGQHKKSNPGRVCA